MDTLRQLQSDNEVTLAELTPEVREQITRELSSCSDEETQAALQILDEIILKANDDAKEELNRLKSSIETCGPQEYSIEGIKSLNQSEVFNLFFERPEMTMVYRAWIHKKISSYPYLSGYNNTIEVTVWKHLVDQLSLGGMFGFVRGQIGDYVAGKYNSVREAFSSEGEDNEQSEAGGIDGLVSVFESLEGVAGAFDFGDGESESVSGFIENIQGFIDTTTKDYFQNIGFLDTLLKQEGYISEDGNILKSEVSYILDNPYIMSALGKDGKYIGEYGEIILGENGSIQISSQTAEEISSIQQNFIQEVGELTSTNGKNIDGLREKTQKIAGLLSKLGFDSESLQGFREFLEGIPGIGGFLAAILGFFVNDMVISELDKIGMSDAEKAALENFGAFIKDSENKEKLPFTLREEKPGELNSAEVRSFKGLLRKIKNINLGDNDVTEEAIQAIFNDPKLTEKILTGNGIGENELIIKNVHEKISSMFGSGSKPSQEDFFKKLKDINLNETIPDVKNTSDSTEVKDPSDSSVSDDEVPTEDADTIPNFSEALSFPFLYNGAEINYNSENYELQVGEKTFTISRIGPIAITPEILSQAQPSINLGEKISFSYSFFGRENNTEIDRINFSDLFDQLISGNEGTLTISQGPSEDSALMALFTLSE